VGASVSPIRLKAEDRLNVDDLHGMLLYDRETGLFTWLVNNTRTRIGDIAGTVGLRGYIVIKIKGVSVRAHRLAWFFETGSWPTNEIDHINGDTGDNRFANLREADRPQNMYNCKMRANNKSGEKGVHWCKKKEKWIAQIGANAGRIFLGSFDKKEDASAAYKNAAKKLHKEFART